MDICADIVRHVTNNYNKFAIIITHNRHGNNHETKEEYILDMLQYSIYIGFCELVAAVKINISYLVLPFSTSTRTKFKNIKIFLCSSKF